MAARADEAQCLQGCGSGRERRDSASRRRRLRDQRGLELDWLTVLFPGLWAISLFFARFRPGVILRLQLYVSLFVMPFLINLMIRWQIARSWKQWLEWGVEASQMTSSDATGPVERGRGR